MADHPGGDARTTITVLTTQLDALRQAIDGDLTDEELYSAAAIAVLLYLPAGRGMVPRSSAEERG